MDLFFSRKKNRQNCARKCQLPLLPSEEYLRRSERVLAPNHLQCQTLISAVTSYSPPRLCRIPAYSHEPTCSQWASAASLCLLSASLKMPLFLCCPRNKTDVTTVHRLWCCHTPSQVVLYRRRGTSCQKHPRVEPPPATQKPDSRELLGVEAPPATQKNEQRSEEVLCAAQCAPSFGN